MNKRKKITLLVLLPFLASGCEEKRVDFNLYKRSPQESALAAMKSGSADTRYKTLVELAKSKSLGADWAVKAMIVIVRTDPSGSVRALAAHNLGRVGDRRVVAVLVEALEDTDDRVRTASAWALAQVNVPGCGVDAQTIFNARKTLRAVLSSDTALDVRLYSAKALGQYKTSEVLMSLVAALKDNDFAVRYEAEMSLVRLTGVTFRGNPEKWLAWLKDHPDPFKNAGHIPAELVPPKQNAFQKARDDFDRFYYDWQGPSKR